MLSESIRVKMTVISPRKDMMILDLTDQRGNMDTHIIKSKNAEWYQINF